MRDKVLEILSSIRQDIDFEKETRLVSDGLLESLDIVDMMVQLEDEFDIQIPPELLLEENLNSVDAIIEMIDGIK